MTDWRPPAAVTPAVSPRSLGHWGEMIPWFLDRLDEALPQRATGLDRSIGDYVRQNVWYTPSGMFTAPHLRFCTEVLGTDRMIYSVDCPFVGNAGARAWVCTVIAVQTLVAHGRAAT
ncbi:hypothetical protein ACIRD8_03800 [Streptomyces sp. NPDC102451]|uniref:hypothetical protein n=1 Tax=Streptomyces sp. NPDC102451 TaxID=3366177 RepID=UPI003816706A